MKALLVGVCSPRPGSGIERGGLMVAAALQRLKKSFMNFALSRRRRRLERAFPSVPLADFVFMKPMILVTILLGLVWPVILSAPELHTIWFCKLGFLQDSSKEDREVAKYWCDWTVLICQSFLFLIVGGVVVTEEITDRFRRRLQSSEEAFDRRFSMGEQLSQEAKKIINEDIDRLLRDSSNLRIVKNMALLNFEWVM
jgi:hypothetical protein